MTNKIQKLKCARCGGIRQIVRNTIRLIPDHVLTEPVCPRCYLVFLKPLFPNVKAAVLRKTDVPPRLYCRYQDGVQYYQNEAIISDIFDAKSYNLKTIEGEVDIFVRLPHVVVLPWRPVCRVSVSSPQGDTVTFEFGTCQYLALHFEK